MSGASVRLAPSLWAAWAVLLLSQGLFYLGGGKPARRRLLWKLRMLAGGCLFLFTGYSVGFSRGVICYLLLPIMLASYALSLAIVRFCSQCGAIGGWPTWPKNPGGLCEKCAQEARNRSTPTCGRTRPAGGEPR